jgi:diguanylate cyclase (GGDEF)-like protein
MHKVSDVSLKLFSKYLLVGLFPLAVLGLPISLIRVYEVGFQPVFVLHTILALSIFFMFAFRKKIHCRTIILISCLVFCAVSIGGILNFGLISNFLVYINLVALILTISFGIKFSLFFLGFSLVFVSVFAYLYIHGILIYPVDLNIYATSFSAWAIVLFAGFVSNGIIIVAFGNMQKNLQDKIEELNVEKQKVENLANHDTLTGLTSFRLSSERIEMAIDLAARTNHKVALLFIDLDGFKLVNDTRGHDAGDKVLIEIAKRINNIVRNSDMTCRVGGDEFLVVLPEVYDTKKVENLCIRLLSEIEKPVEYDGIHLSISASIGISIYPDNANDFKTLKKLADAAMYQVKKSGKGSYLFASDYADKT